MKIISEWFQRFFHDPQAVILTVVLVLLTSVILIMGQDLAPVLASMVIAYLLEGVVQLLQRGLRVPRLLASTLVFVLFITFVLFLLLGLLPMLSQQLSQLIQQLPNMIVKGQNLLLSLPAMYP
ncbi:MAG: AI-2E family transporter, partial [Phycisphaerales bacterium]|nr:AI-2E family transporter [Phycisphaerales bacterium]